MIPRIRIRCLRVSKTLLKPRIKLCMILKTPEPNGQPREELSITKSSQVRTLALTIHHQDSTTTRSSMVRAWSLMFQDQANTHTSVTNKSLWLLRPRISLQLQSKHDQVHSSNQEARQWRTSMLSLIARIGDLDLRDFKPTTIRWVQDNRLVQDPTSTSKTQWLRKVSIWAWNTVISYEEQTLLH